MRFAIRSVAIVILAAILVTTRNVLLASSARAMEKGSSFSAPSLDDYILIGQDDGDGDGDGTKETHILRCRDLAGDSVFTMKFAQHHRSLALWERVGARERSGARRHFIIRGASARPMIVSMTTKGRLWAWSREQHAGGAGLDHNYVIRDSNCDGIFDERSSLDEQFHIPDCLE
jgi:hypothetical protein